MDDNSSIASFEEVSQPNSLARRGVDREGLSEDLRERARARLGIQTSASPDLSDDEVPDVCYVLQYKEFGSKVAEVHRSSKPIDINLGHNADYTESSDKKPVLEIVTLVSRDYSRGSRNAYSPPPPPGCCDWDRPARVTVTDIIETEDTEMVIHSGHLINALRAIVGYYPGGTSFTGDRVKIEAPYEILIHHRAALAQYKFSQPSCHDADYASTTVKHIDILLGFLEKTYGSRIRAEEARHERSTPTATWEYLWLLLRPGEVVYTKLDNVWTPFVISEALEGPRDSYGQDSYDVICWSYMYFDGKLRRRMHTINIKMFSGEEAIHNLPAIPARFFTGPDKNMLPSEVTAEQVRLGRFVWDLYKAPIYKSYDGQLAGKPPTNDNEEYSTSITGHRSGRVMVDAEGYELYLSARDGLEWRQRGYRRSPNHIRAPNFDQLPYFAARCGCAACTKSEGVDDLSPFVGFQDLNPKHDKAPESDLYYHVVSKVVPGFLMSDRTWAHFYAENLGDIKFDKEAFKYLVLDDEVKQTVKAMIGKFANLKGQAPAWPNDFVKNKGQGRIFLLHGPPGVGKTCTAECVAELMQRPLLSLTSGDLSTYAGEAERNLEYFLQLGERFGAMVLLDEADVYLESREHRDIGRNGLVSVFLRALEYYRGVLFLTTNRVRTFDPAFTSRIHIALRYRALNDTDRERIWMSAFERLERDSGGRVRAAVTAREYAWGSTDVRSLRWNGREIRNALQTAVALAESDALEDGEDTVLITEKHLRKVTRMSRDFRDFMKNRKSQDEDDDGESSLSDGEDDERDDAHYHELPEVNHGDACFSDIE